MQMNQIREYLSFCAAGQLVDCSTPLVMGIVNVTPDSFAVRCSSCTEAGILHDASVMLQQGADILDIGGYSTRPNAPFVSEEEEWQRLRLALKTIRNAWPDVPVSVDTFRSEIARRAVSEYATNIINDVSGGQWDEQMFATVAQLGVPYVLTHTYWLTPDQQKASCEHDVVSDVLAFLQKRLDQLHQAGVADVIIDPGFGLGKTVEESYCLLREMAVLQVLHAPVLAGLSRKSMFFKPLQITPKDALNATTAANVLALERGANILRVHDVKAAREAVQVVQLTYSYSL